MKQLLEIALAVCALAWFCSLALWTAARYDRDTLHSLWVNASADRAPQLLKKYEGNRRLARMTVIILAVTTPLAILLAIAASAAE